MIDAQSTARECDWLAQRFDDLSRQFPRLSLVVALPPDHIENALVDDEFGDGHHPFFHPHHDRFAHQVLRENWGILSGPQSAKDTEPYRLAFPYWKFDFAFEGAALWAMWLHRTYGRDPAIEAEMPEPIEQLKCLEGYGGIVDRAGELIANSLSELSLPPWVHHICETAFFAQIGGLDVYSRFSAYWLVTLALVTRSEKHELWCPEPIPNDPEPVTPTQLRVILDVGVDSRITMLRLADYFRRFSEHRKLIAPTAVDARITPRITQSYVSTEDDPNPKNASQPRIVNAPPGMASQLCLPLLASIAIDFDAANQDESTVNATTEESISNETDSPEAVSGISGFSEQSPSDIGDVFMKLTALERLIFELLNRTTRLCTFDDLSDAWSKEVVDSTVSKALKRLRDKLPRSQWYFMISEAKREVVWKKKKGQTVP